MNCYSKSPERQAARVPFGCQRLAWVAAIVALTAPLTAQQFIATGRDTLRDLPGIEIAVEPLPSELSVLGIDARSLRADVERRLRAGSVTVYRSQAENPSPAKPYLYVHLNAVALPTGSVAVAVQVQVRQTLRSPVTASNIVNAMTWDSHTVVVAPAGAGPALLAEVGTHVDRFVRDWQAVHPPNK